MGTTQPTRASKAWLRLNASVNAGLERFVKSRCGRSKRKREAAIARAAIVPLGGDELRQEVTAITSLIPAVREAIERGTTVGK